MSLFLILTSTVILVAFFHMIAPDHWIPLLIISKTRNYTARTKYSTAVLLGIGHSGSSVLIAVAVLFVGAEILKISVHLLTYISIILMFIIAAYFIINGVRESRENSGGLMAKSALAVSIFPDLAFLPIFIAAFGMSAGGITYIILVFIAVTTGTLTAVVFVTSNIPGTDRLKQLPGPYTDYLIGLILIITGIIIYLGF